MKASLDNIGLSKSNLILVLFLKFALFTSAAGQDAKLAWLGEYIAFSELLILQPAYSNYSEQDLRNFRARLKTIRSTADQNEWEGRFFPGGEDAVGISVLDISLRNGFASLYIYTCFPELRAIDYGSVNNLPDMIELVSEVPLGSPRKSKRVKLVKVRWGDHLFLVNEKSLAVWAEKAVGRYVPLQDAYEQNWTDYWAMGDKEAPYTGRPTLPARFRHLERTPIEGGIIATWPRKIATDFSSGVSFHGGDSAVYRVRVNVGSSGGVRKEMTFRLKGTNEELTVVKVGQSTSEAIIVRAINDDTRADHCLSDDFQPVPIQCPTIRAGLGVSTIVGKFWF